MTTYINLFEVIKDAYQKKLPFVAYKKPNSLKVTSILQNDDHLHIVNDYSEEGFVFAPFDSKQQVILIPVDKTFSAEIDLSLKFSEEVKVVQPESVTVKIKHQDFVKTTADFIQNSDVSKIVIARAKEVKLEKFDPFQVFQKLISKYSHATCYIWFHPKVGLWMGATPETLLETESNYFKTMSLAGTQKFVGTTQVVWGEKEIEEQQLVTDYVLSNLKPVTSVLKNSETYTVKAGALLHLRTDIRGEFSHENGVASLLNVLHPTPAVCGFPREFSKKFILQNENFDRSYYTGFLGELNINTKSSLYVNLRCLEQVEKNTIRLYVGGGITQKSNPEKEWEETVAKCRTMESVL